jgi:hypothetical protein
VYSALRLAAHAECPSSFASRKLEEKALGSGSLLLQEGANLRILRKLTGDLLGINFLTVSEDIEATVIVWGERQLTDALLVCSE